MKFLILVFCLYSVTSWAGYVAGSKANQCNRTDYGSLSICQESENEACYKVPNDLGECGVFKFKDLYGSQKYESESCSGEIVCQAILQEKSCGLNKWALIDLNFTEVYCVDVIGKDLVIDTVVKAQKDAVAAQANALKNALGQVKKLRECLIGVIDVLVLRNASKNLSIPQVKSMVATYQPIQDLLYAASGATAKLKISEVVADGVLVTEGDKTALTNEIDKCLGN